VTNRIYFFHHPSPSPDALCQFSDPIYCNCAFYPPLYFYYTGDRPAVPFRAKPNLSNPTSPTSVFILLLYPLPFLPHTTYTHLYNIFLSTILTRTASYSLTPLTLTLSFPLPRIRQFLSYTAIPLLYSNGNPQPPSSQTRRTPTLLALLPIFPCNFNANPFCIPSRSCRLSIPVAVSYDPAAFLRLNEFLHLPSYPPYCAAPANVYSVSSSSLPFNLNCLSSPSSVSVPTAFAAPAAPTALTAFTAAATATLRCCLALLLSSTFPPYP
jgi:hypothetical protein